MQARNAHNSQFTVLSNLGFSHKLETISSIWLCTKKLDFFLYEYSFICIFTARWFHDLIKLEIYDKRNNYYFISRNLPWPFEFAQYAFFGIAVPLFHTYSKVKMREIMLKVAFQFSLNIHLICISINYLLWCTKKSPRFLCENKKIVKDHENWIFLPENIYPHCKCIIGSAKCNARFSINTVTNA